MIAPWESSVLHAVEAPIAPAAIGVERPLPGPYIRFPIGPTARRRHHPERTTRAKERVMRRFIPGMRIGVIAVAAFSGVGCSWSASPPPATETTSVAGEDYGLYCTEHGVPEKFCTLCHEELKESLLLCKEHGDIPEEICTLCHPDVEEKYDIAMCPKGHGLPEHFCSECAAEPAA